MEYRDLISGDLLPIMPVLIGTTVVATAAGPVAGTSKTMEHSPPVAGFL